MLKTGQEKFDLSTYVLVDNILFLLVFDALRY